MFAIIETGSKQYHIKTGDIIKVEKLEAEVGSSVKFDRVLALGGKVGSAVSADASVIAEVIDQRKNEKEIIFKKKRRHNYRRKRGHRQLITVLKITEVKG